MKTDRWESILQLISEQTVETQEQLAALLKEKGYEVTQATVSRDIRRLGLTKVPAPGGRQRYAVVKQEKKAEGKYLNVLKEGFLSADTAGNILVIKTAAGMAMAVAAAIDAMEFQQVVGSIAGDDTIMAAIKNEDAAKELKLLIEAMLRE